MKKLHLLLAGALRRTSTGRQIDGARAVGVGTVCTGDGEPPPVLGGERQVLVQVIGAHGSTFTGRLIHHDGVDPSILRPGLVILVAFNPESREQLSLPDDILAVRAAVVKRT